MLTHLITRFAGSFKFHIVPRATADSEEVEQALSSIPKNHPRPHSHDPPGLPQGCITYADRYKYVNSSAYQ